MRMSYTPLQMQSNSSELRVISTPTPLPKISGCCRQNREISTSEVGNSVTNAVVALAIETTSSAYGVLVYCSSRQGSQLTVILINGAMPIKQISAGILDKGSDLIPLLQALPGG